MEKNRFIRRRGHRLGITDLHDEKCMIFPSLWNGLADRFAALGFQQKISLYFLPPLLAFRLRNILAGNPRMFHSKLSPFPPSFVRTKYNFWREIALMLSSEMFRRSGCFLPGIFRGEPGKKVKFLPRKKLENRESEPGPGFRSPWSNECARHGQMALSRRKRVSTTTIYVTFSLSAPIRSLSNPIFSWAARGRKNIT